MERASQARPQPSSEERRTRRINERKTSDTFDAVLTAFCQAKQHQRQIAQTEKEILRSAKRCWIRPVAEIERRDIVELVRARKARGAERSAHNFFANLQRVMNWAVDNDVIERSPMAGLRPKSLIGAKTIRQRVLTD